MSLLSTCVGAYPRPAYLTAVDGGAGAHERGDGAPRPPDVPAEAVEAVEALLVRGTREAIEDQSRCRIDIPTDGQIRRESYLHYHCRHLSGIALERPGGAGAAPVPTVTGPITARALFLSRDWEVAQAFTGAPVKMNMPGPMTLAEALADEHYGDPATLGAALAQALNREVLALAAAGCTHIQVDEPVFARKPDQALAYGIDNLEGAFQGCPEQVVRTLHLCSGDPTRPDDPNHPEASPTTLERLAGAINDSSIMAVSIDDAHQHHDLALLEHFTNTQVILGVVAVARSRVETIEEIRQRLEAALDHIDSHRLLAAPNGGLGLLGRERAMAKLKNLASAAHSIGSY